MLAWRTCLKPLRLVQNTVQSCGGLRASHTLDPSQTIIVYAANGNYHWARVAGMVRPELTRTQLRHMGEQMHRSSKHMITASLAGRLGVIQVVARDAGVLLDVQASSAVLMAMPIDRTVSRPCHGARRSPVCNRRPLSHCLIVEIANPRPVTKSVTMYRRWLDCGISVSCFGIDEPQNYQGSELHLSVRPAGTNSGPHLTPGTEVSMPKADCTYSKKRRG